MTTPLQKQDKFLAFRRRMAELQCEVARVCGEVRETERPKGTVSFEALDGLLFKTWNRYMDNLGHAADRCIPGEGRLGWVRVETDFHYICHCCKGNATNGWYIPQNFPNSEYMFCTKCKESRLT